MKPDITNLIDTVYQYGFKDGFIKAENLLDDYLDTYDPENRDLYKLFKHVDLNEKGYCYNHFVLKIKDYQI